jgi:uncharacterized lipoprotein NlpE involved in copper resistance
MNIKIRRINGSTFTKEDRLEVLLDTNGKDLHICEVTVESVDGVDITHGGGGASGEYLHYKSADRDANDAGIIDYTNTEINVEQLEKGSSIIKVVYLIITKEDADANLIAHTAWTARKTVAAESEETFSEEEPRTTETLLSSSPLSLEWNDDAFV